MDLIKAIDIISNDSPNQNYNKNDKINAIQFLTNQMVNPVIRLKIQIFILWEIYIFLLMKKYHRVSKIFDCDYHFSFESNW